MTDDEYRRMGYTTFPEAPVSEPGVVAILITKDPNTNEYKTYIREYEGYQAPDPELVAMVAQSTEIRNI